MKKKWIILILMSLFLVAACGNDDDDDDASASGNICASCHDAGGPYIKKKAEYETSVHATGEAYARGASSSCAPCHSNEGFQDAVASSNKFAIFGGDDEDFEAPSGPSGQSCRTCHLVHEGLAEGEESSFDLRTTASVKLVGDLTGNLTVNIGKGNLCANCHQTRNRGYDLNPANGSAAYTITSSHFGPHHGAQTNVLVGVGAYRVGGSATPSQLSGAHTSSVENGCVSCHLVTHTFQPNLDACQSCHSGLDTFDRNGVQSDVETAMATLEGKLIAAGVLEEEQEWEFSETDGSAVQVGTGEFHPVTGATTMDAAGCLFNYFLIVDDGSHGVHNPAFVKKILTECNVKL